MAGQGNQRRDFIRTMGMISLAGAFPGFQRWIFACPNEGLGTAVITERSKAFHPQFFTAEEFELLDRLADLIIPADDAPGAHDAGVAEFIDFMVANEADLTRSQEGNIQARFHS